MKKFFNKFLAIAFIGAMVTFVGCKDWQEDFDDINDRIDALESGQIATMEEQIANLQASVAELESFTSEEADKLAALTALVNEEIAELEAELETKASKEELAAEVASLTAQLNEVKAELEESIADAKSDIADLEDSVADLEASVEDLEAEDVKLQGYIDAINESIKGIESDIDELENQVGLLNDKIKELEDVDAAMAEDIADMAEDIEGILADISVINGNIKTLQSDMETAKADILANAAAIEALDSKYAGITDALSTRIDTVVSDLSALTERVTANEEDIAELQEQVKEIAELRARIEALEEAVDANEKAIAAIEEKCKELEAAIEENAADILENAADIKENAADITLLYGKVTDLYIEIDKLSDAIDTINETIETIQGDITKLKEVTEDLQDQIDEIIENFDTWCGEFMATYWDYLYELDPTSEEWADFYACIEAAILSALDNDYTVLSEYLADLEAWRVKVDEYIESLQDDMDKAQSDIETLYSRYDELREDVDLNTADIAELLGQIQSISYVPTADGGVMNTNVVLYTSYSYNDNEKVNPDNGVEFTDNTSSVMSFDIRPADAAKAIADDFNSEEETKLGTYAIEFENLTRAITATEITSITLVDEEKGRVEVAFRTENNELLEDAALAFSIKYQEDSARYIDIMSSYELLEREEVNLVAQLWTSNLEENYRVDLYGLEYSVVYSSVADYTMMSYNDTTCYYEPGNWNRSFEAKFSEFTYDVGGASLWNLDYTDCASYTLAELEAAYNIVIAEPTAERGDYLNATDGDLAAIEYFNFSGDDNLTITVNTDAVTADYVGAHMACAVNYDFNDGVLELAVPVTVRLAAETSDWTTSADGSVVWNYADAVDYIVNEEEQLIPLNDIEVAGCNEFNATNEELSAFIAENSERIGVIVSNNNGTMNYLLSLSLRYVDEAWYLVVPGGENASLFNNLYTADMSNTYSFAINVYDEDGVTNYTFTVNDVKLESYPAAITTAYEQDFVYGDGELMEMTVNATDIYNETIALYFTEAINLNEAMLTKVLTTRSAYRNEADALTLAVGETNILYSYQTLEDADDKTFTYNVALAHADFLASTDEFTYSYMAEFQAEVSGAVIMPYSITLTSTVDATVDMSDSFAELRKSALYFVTSNGSFTNRINMTSSYYDSTPARIPEDMLQTTYASSFAFDNIPLNEIFLAYASTEDATNNPIDASRLEYTFSIVDGQTGALNTQILTDNQLVYQGTDGLVYLVAESASLDGVELVGAFEALVGEDKTFSAKANENQMPFIEGVTYDKLTLNSRNDASFYISTELSFVDRRGFDVFNKEYAGETNGFWASDAAYLNAKANSVYKATAIGGSTVNMTRAFGEMQVIYNGEDYSGLVSGLAFDTATGLVTLDADNLKLQGTITVRVPVTITNPWYGPTSEYYEFYISDSF